MIRCAGVHGNEIMMSLRSPIPALVYESPEKLKPLQRILSRKVYPIPLHFLLQSNDTITPSQSLCRS
jgi:hypothetical protein